LNQFTICDDDQQVQRKRIATRNGHWQNGQFNLDKKSYLELDEERESGMCTFVCNFVFVFFWIEIEKEELN